MKKLPISLILFFCLATPFYAFGQPKVMIKLDDIGVKNNVCQAKEVIDLLIKRKVKAGLGVIANRLDSTAKHLFSPYLNAKDNNGDALIEIWSHGLYHSKNNPPNNNLEFKGTSFDLQQKHFNRANQLVLKYLGVQMHTFGAPFNASDENTHKVIAANANYKVFLLSGIQTEGQNGLANYNNRINMESTPGLVNYDYFVSQYEKLKNKYSDYIVLQGHPNQWDTSKIAEFNKILDFLINQKSEFVLPYAYYLSIQK